MLASVLAVIDAFVANLAAGAAPMAALSAISDTAWVNLGVSALSAAPAELSALEGLSGPLSSLVQGVVSKVVSAGTSEIAAQAAKDWLAANGERAMQLQPGATDA